MKARSNFARPVAAAIGLTALLGVAPAFAADVITEVPPAPAAPVELPPVNTWSGPYAGVTLGWGFAGSTDLPGAGTEIETDGFTAHGFVGWQGQTGQIVYGAEGDLGYNASEGDANDFTAESDIDGSLRARLGYAVTDDILLYGTGGVAGKRMEVTDTLPGGASDEQTMFGWTVGAGMDAKVTDNMFGRVEYRYTDYGSEDFNLGALSGVQSVESTEHRIGIGFGVQF